MNEREVRQDQMIEEMKRMNELILKSFKRCISSFHNKVLTVTEKNCIKTFFDYDIKLNEEFMQIASKINQQKQEEEINKINKVKNTWF